MHELLAALESLNFADLLELKTHVDRLSGNPYLGMNQEQYESMSKKEHLDFWDVFIDVIIINSILLMFFYCFLSRASSFPVHASLFFVNCGQTRNA